jgi:two-component system sensor histidine kinase/response regulator
VQHSRPEAESRLPAAVAPDSTQVPRAASKARILLAEDNLVNQRVALHILEKHGYSVTLVANGINALKALDEQTFDLVLMDVQMPEMGGFEATAKIRESEHGRGTHVPIVAMTAHAMSGDRERCLAAGMDGYISKPIRALALTEVVERYRHQPVVS